MKGGTFLAATQSIFHLFWEVAYNVRTTHTYDKHRRRRRYGVAIDIYGLFLHVTFTETDTHVYVPLAPHT